MCCISELREDDRRQAGGGGGAAGQVAASSDGGGETALHESPNCEGEGEVSCGCCTPPDRRHPQQPPCDITEPSFVPRLVGSAAPAREQRHALPGRP